MFVRGLMTRGWASGTVLRPDPWMLHLYSPKHLVTAVRTLGICVDDWTFDASLHDADTEVRHGRRMEVRSPAGFEVAEGARDNREAILRVDLHISPRELEEIARCVSILLWMVARMAKLA
jgi:hypothetical protein